VSELCFLAPGEPFPDTSAALTEPNGLLAVGGDLSPARLLSAYRRGIFPWFEEPQPVLWWSPDPRSVLFPEELHISRSLRKTLRRGHFRLSVDSQFNEVMGLCGALREGDGNGTWIGREMLGAYGELHRLGYAHSVEVSNQHGALVGGLYGVALGAGFFGESMFSLETDASKVALVGLVSVLQRAGYRFIDCQIESDHLNSLGARNLARLDFERLLDQTTDTPTDSAQWNIAAESGELL
jgi:leucyl/phenylalanyl-tRNA--protein transferase